MTLCDTCTEHGCYTPKWNKCVTECDDYKTAWVSVEMALPLRGQYVLVYGPGLNRYGPSVDVGQYYPELGGYGTGWTRHGHLVPRGEITHWQPLPELPEIGS